MKQIFFLYLLLNSVLSFADNNTIVSKWHGSEKIKESDYQPIKNSNILLVISNNNDNVYLNLKIPDKEITNSIISSVLTIWVDMDDKHGKKLGIKYSKQSQTIELIGFITEQERHFAAENPDNFSAKMETAVNGTLYFELLMPVTKLPLRNAKDGKGAMPFTIGLDTGTSGVFWISHIKLAASQ